MVAWANKTLKPLIWMAFSLLFFRRALKLLPIPTTWKHTKVICIWEDNYFEAELFRPITLTSFLLKTIEKFVDMYIRETMMKTFLLSDSQHAYQSSRSTDTALYCLFSVF